MSRLGILGGMFDPVTLGHVNAACHARELLHLDTVKLVPCNQPNHKDSAHEGATHRLKMLELAIASIPQLEVDSCEIDRGDVSYAVDTLRFLRQRNSRSQLVFILGIDSFNSLLSWHHWQDLMDLCHFCVLPRDEEQVNVEVAHSTGLEARQAKQPEELFLSAVGSIYLDTEFSFDSSSTEVRRKLETGNSLNGLLDNSVLKYIHQHELYGSSANGMRNAII